MTVTRELMKEVVDVAAVPGFDAFWPDLGRFGFLRHAHGFEHDEILAPASGAFHYDIAGRLESGTPLDPSAFRLPVAQQVRFELSEASRKELDSALAVWIDTLSGLTKMVTGIRISAQMRDATPLAMISSTAFP